MQDLGGKVAVITGGVRGIGLGLARAFADAGMKLVLTYRRADAQLQEARDFASQAGVQAHLLQLDVTDRAAVMRAAQETLRLYGKVHVLCNNAGVSSMSGVDGATYAEWDWILKVNLYGVINTLAEFVPLIKTQAEGGHVVNVASMSSFITGPMAGAYAASKFAVRGLTEGLRYNLAPHRIGVSLVCPGLTRTEIYRAPWRRADPAPEDEGLLKRLEGIHALGMDPEEVGRKTVAGMRRDDFYIFTHPEFREELQEACTEILDAMPGEEASEPRRLAFEEIRRRMKDQARLAVRQLQARSR